MESGFILTISCVMTTISMIVFLGVILLTARFGSQWVRTLFDRFTGGDKKNDDQQSTQGTGTQPQPQIASSQSLRRRAHDLDFPAPAQAAGATAFAAQSASANNQYPDFPAPNFQQNQPQASLTPRGQTSNFNTQPQQGLTQSFGTPSLSPSRPFQQGSQFNTQSSNQFGQPGQQQFGQQQNFGQQRPNQLGQQQGFNAQGFGQQPPNQLGQQNQQNFGQPRPNQLGQQQQNFGQQQGQQQNYGQQPPNQHGQQQNYGQQPQQQGGLGQNRPPLRSLPRPGNTQYDRPIGGRDRRQGDDRDLIYDDRSSGNFVDDVGDFIDNF